VRCGSAWTSCEEPGVHTVAEASTREHPREATIVEQARVMPKCANIAPWQMRCIQGHIAANLQSDIRIADLAGIVGCSSYRIKHVFKINFGCTPHQYLIRRRVERAQRLLLMSDDSLTCSTGSWESVRGDGDARRYGRISEQLRRSALAAGSRHCPAGPASSRSTTRPTLLYRLRRSLARDLIARGPASHETDVAAQAPSGVSKPP
jgi:AraC-like DNA-binding protein